MLKRIFRALAVAGAVTVALATAGSAGADAGGYINELDSMGIPYADAQPMIKLGVKLCEGFRAGVDLSTVFTILNDNSPFTPYQNGQITAAAVDQFCPEQMDRLLTEASHLQGADNNSLTV